MYVCLFICVAHTLFAADDETKETCMMQKGCFVKLVDGKLSCDHPECTGKLKLLSNEHNHTVGIYHFVCTETMNARLDKNRHTKTWKSQHLFDGNYFCNRLAVSAEFMSGGSWTQMNQRHDLLGMPRIPESFYEDEKNRVAAICEKQSKLQVEQNWREFKALAAELKIVAFDMRHASSRASKQSTFEVLRVDNHKCIFVCNVDTARDTGNAWRNEEFATKLFFQQCVDQSVELSAACHDQCATASKIIQWYNVEMTRKNIHYEPCTDANDMWHGMKSFDKEFAKKIEESIANNKPTKVSAEDNEKKNDKEKKIAHDLKAIIVEDNKVAESQLRRAAPRIHKIFMQSCHANKGNVKAATQFFQATVQRCILYDEHSYCERLAGQDCLCVLDKQMRDAHDSIRTAVERETLRVATSFSQDKRDNGYLLQAEIARAAATHCISLDDGSYIPKKPTKKRKKKDDKDEAAAPAEAIDDPDAVFMEVQKKDPLQPVDTQVTHPIAIECIIGFITSNRVRSLIANHVWCLNTSYVESMHNMELIYAPKRKHFRKTYDARIHLALLDWDENIDREMIETDGPEGGKPGKCKPPKTFAFQHKVAAEVHGPKYWL